MTVAPEAEPTVTIDLADLKRELSESIDKTLKAELALLELRLVKSMTDSMNHKADATIVQEMDKRIAGLENTRAAREGMPNDILALSNRVGALEKFRYAVPSVAFISMVLSMILVYYYTLR